MSASTRWRPAWLVLLPALAGCAQKPSAPPAPVAPTEAPAVVDEAPEPFADRFETLTTRLEEGLDKFHVPGMAVAVVYDDRVIYAHGFGYENLEEKVPVTPRTRFAIGSSTKAFTAAAIGQLVDEGTMSWDDPLTKWVPEFTLAVKSDDAAAQATIRDALCHRTGFTRMGVLWASGDVPRKEFLAQAAKAEPMADFRETFLYNNVTYTAAGEASARAADVLWAELVDTKILQPLGMKNSIILSEEAKNAGMAQGYLWEKEKKQFKAVPMRSLDEIAPAGAINSTVLDMTAWVRMQINAGSFEGQTLIEPATLKETWTPQIDVGGSMKYGLGWFIADYEGQPMLHHGGNIDGYAAMVSFLPEEKLGFVMLSNVSFSPMQDAVRGIVYDTLLEESAAPAAEEDVAAFEGKYVAGFGPFAGKSFTVSSKDGALFVDVPGQQNYELKAPGEDGKRPFAVTDTIAVKFAEVDGAVNAMHLFQGGFDFELFREGYTPPAEVPLETLQPMLGRYEHSVLGQAEVLVRNNRLAIDVPKQMVYELFPPNEEGHWAFRVKPDITIEFVPAKRPRKVVLHQGGQTFDLTRVKKAAGDGPSMAKLEKARRSGKAERALGKLGVVKVTAKVRFAQSGVDGTTTIFVAPDGRMLTRTDLGKFGWSETMVAPEGGWEVSAFGPQDDLVGNQLAQSLLLSPLLYGRRLSTVFDEVEVEGSGTLGDTDVVRIAGTKGALPTVKMQLDAKTGDILQSEYDALWNGPGGIRTTERLSDYRTALGLRLPHAMERKTVQSGTVVVTDVVYSTVDDDPATLFPAEPPSDR